MRHPRCDDWKTYKNRGVKQKSALRHPVFSYSMGDTLISPIVASYLLYLAVTYTLIRTYLDKPDNLHFNGDYRKKLNCSHYYLGIFMYDWTNNILYAKYPLGKPKKTDTPFRERMPALICHTLPKWCIAKIQLFSRITNRLIRLWRVNLKMHQFNLCQPHLTGFRISQNNLKD